MPAIGMRRALFKKHLKSAMYFFNCCWRFHAVMVPHNALVSFLTLLSIRLNSVATSACSVFA